VSPETWKDITTVEGAPKESRLAPPLPTGKADIDYLKVYLGSPDVTAEEKAKALLMPQHVNQAGNYFSFVGEAERAEVLDELDVQLADKTGPVKSLVAGLRASVPGKLGMSRVEQGAHAREAPIAFTAGQVGGTVAQAMATAGPLTGAIKSIAGIPAIAQTPLWVNAAGRVATAMGISAAQKAPDVVEGKESLRKALIDVAQSGGAGLVSVVPEVLVPANALQLLAQPLADLVYDATVGKLRGQDIASSEWWKGEALNLAISAGFALRDVMSGETFRSQQDDYRYELDEWRGKHKGPVELITIKTGPMEAPEVKAKVGELATAAPKPTAELEGVPKAEKPQELVEAKAAVEGAGPEEPAPAVGETQRAGIYTPEPIPPNPSGKPSNPEEVDALTGLGGRGAWDHGVRRDLASVDPAKGGNGKMAVALIDRGNQKGLNDTYGYNGTDQILRELNAIEKKHIDAARAKGINITEDRTGGDEFGVRAPGLNAAELEDIVAPLEQEVRAFVARAVYKDMDGNDVPLRDVWHGRHEDVKTGAGHIAYGIADLDDVPAGSTTPIRDMMDRADKDAHQMGLLQSWEAAQKQTVDNATVFVYDNKGGKGSGKILREASLIGKLMEDHAKEWAGKSHEEQVSLARQEIDRSGRYERTVAPTVRVHTALGSESGLGSKAGKAGATAGKPTAQATAPAAVQVTAKPTETGTQPASGELQYGAKLPEKVPGANLEKVLTEGLDRITAGKEAYDAKRLIVETADRMGPQIEQARRGVQTWKDTDKEIQDLVNVTGYSARDLAKRARGEAYNAAHLKLAHDMMVTSAARTTRKLAEIYSKPSGEISDADIANARLALAEHAVIQSQFAGARAEAGRALQILRRTAQEIQGKNTEALMNLLGDKQTNIDILKKIAEMDPGNTLGLSIVARDLARATTADQVHEVWINMLLSHPLTHVVNITSNALTTLYRTSLEKPAQAAIEAVTKGKKRQVFFREVPAELYGSLRALPEALKVGAESFAKGTVGGKAEAVSFKAVPGKVGGILRTPTRLLGAADQVFKTLIRRGQLHALAYRNARLEGLKGDALTKRIAELETAPTEAMLAKADQEAAYRTYTQPLGAIGKWVLLGRQKFPPMRFIAPFITTPTNIAKFAVERTPIGLVNTMVKMSKGKVSKADISDELAKSLVGSTLMAGIATLAAQGHITGGGPRDKNERYALYRTGWQPYSVKIGDKYYSYARMEPLGSILGMAADLGDMVTNAKGADDAAARMAFCLSKNLVSKTYLQGISTLIDAIHEPERYGERWVQQLGGTVIPSGVAGLARATDKELKEIDGMRDVYCSRTPGLTQFVKPRRDLWGNAIEREGNFWTLMFSPVQVSAAKGNKVDQEIVRLGAGLSPPKKSFAVTESMRKANAALGKVDDIELAPAEYDKYSVMSGKDAYVRVASRMVSDEYQGAGDERKESMIRSDLARAREAAKEALVQQVVARYVKEEKLSPSEKYALHVEGTEP
jgi:GGDEF domain-containing protein